MSNAGRMVLVLLLAAGLAAAIWVVVHVVVSSDGIEPETVPSTSVAPLPGADSPEPRVPRPTQNSANPPHPIPAPVAESANADIPEPAPTEPGPRLVIQVVDQDGRPVAGVPVKLVGLREPIWKGLTAEPDGKVSVNNITEIVARFRKLHRITAAIDCPLPEPVETELDAAKLPTTPVKLVLPPTGSLRIRLEGPGAKAGTEMLLRTSDQCTWCSDSISIDPSGEVLLPFVGLGLDLLNRVYPRDLDYAGIEDRAVYGPTRSGEEVTATVCVDQQHPILVGRAVKPDGAPIRNQRLSCFLNPVRFPWSPSLIQTDEQGRFRFRMEGTYNAIEDQLWLMVDLDDTAGLPNASPVSIDLSGRRFPPGETDIGDVVFQSNDRILSGRVVDEQGRPIAGARVYLCDMDSLDAFLNHDPRRHAEGLSLARDREIPEPRAIVITLFNGNFGPFNDCPNETDRNGFFALHANYPTGMLRAWIRKEGWYGEPARLVQRGARDEVFVLRRAATLNGSIRLAPGFEPGKLHVRLVGEPAATGDHTDPWHWSTKEPPPLWNASTTTGLKPLESSNKPSTRSGPEGKKRPQEYAFSFEGLRSGRGRVEIRLNGQPDPVRVFHDVAIEAGQKNGPRQLHGVDLTGEFRTVSVTVLDGKGDLPDNTEIRLFRGRVERWAYYVVPGQSCSWQRRSDGDKTLFYPLILCRDSRLDLEVMAPGYRVERIEDVRGDVRVVLQPGLPIRLVLPEKKEPLDWGAYLVFLTYATNKRRFLFKSDRESVYAGQTLQSVATRVSRFGRYRVTVQKIREDIVDLADHEIEVRDVPTEQEFVIPVTTPER